MLALDAESAFDRCLRQILVSELYKAHMPPAAILLIDTRLASRSTVYEWDVQVMGPAVDITGFEQGGVNSSDFYKLYNNEQLKTAQDSMLGVDIGSQVISAIGQADDVILMTSSLYNLQMLVTLTEQYCSKFRVKLEPSKTKLLAYCQDKQSFLVDHALNCQEIKINSKAIKIATEVEHVGIVRSTTGNLPHIVNRIAMHKNSLHALLPAGTGGRHRGNPAASLRLGQIYGTPVLLSGMSSLVLSKSELDILDGHYLKTLHRLLKLHDRTPRSIVYFLAGSLPASAILHQRQMSVLSMVCHLKSDPLHSHAKFTLLNSKKCKHSWFTQVRDLCLQYGLPHPSTLLEDPPPKLQLKRLVKTKITEYWQQLLVTEALSKTSLSHFHPFMHSLSQPHPLWAAAGSSPYEVNKSIILARMISGRYRTESLARFWTDNRNGYCLAHTCDQVVGDLQHLLLHCPALQLARSNLEQMWLAKAAALPSLHSLIVQVLRSSPAMKMTFLLDPTSIPAIISLYQTNGVAVIDDVFFMTRTFAYALHRKKLILTGKWPYSTKNENFCPDNSEYSNSLIIAGSTATTPDGSDVPPMTSSCQPLSHNICLISTSDAHYVCQANSPQQSDPTRHHDMAIQLPEQQPLNGPAADSDGCHHGTGGLTGGRVCDQEIDSLVAL